jgi:hypothetical protein
MTPGDLVTSGVPLAWLIAIGGTVVGGVFALLKWFAGRMLAEIEGRLKRIDDIEARFERLLAELPLHYQRRDDAIREYTAINAKLDRLYELMMRDRA